MKPALLSRHLASDLSHIKPFESIPGPTPFPLIGNIWRYLPLVGQYKIDRLYENAQYNKQRYGTIVREQITKNHTILHLFDPCDIKSFTKHDGQRPNRRSHRALLKYRQENPTRYNDGGLFPENGDNWLRLRRTFQHYLMNKSQVSRRAQLLDQVTCKSIADTLEDGKRIREFEHFLHIWSLKCSLAVFLDYGENDMPNEEVLQLMIRCLHDELEAIDGTEIRSERWNTEPSKCPFFQKLSKVENTLYNIVDGRVDDLLTDRSTIRSTVSYVGDWLLKEGLDRKDVITFILDCILAGLHTTAYTTTFLLKYISQWDLNKQERLRLEVCKNFPPFGTSLTQDMQDDMPMLLNCFRETLRLKPVAIGTGRVTQHEMVIRDYHIPKGIMVIAHNQAICMDPNIYEQPDQFKPERWSDYRTKSRPSPFARMPFGFGPRSCIGQQLISLQINILAARLLQQYEWKFIDHVRTKSMMVHCLVGHIDVNFTKIKC